MCEKVEKYGDERERNGLLAGMEKGLKKGKEEGKSEAKIENAKNLIALGKLSLEDIADCTGLPLSKIEELAL